MVRIAIRSPSILLAAAIMTGLSPCLAQTSSEALNRVYEAVKAKPRFTAVPRTAGAYAYYNMRVDHLCGRGSISEAAIGWVDESLLPGTSRAVAMSATFTFPDAYPARPDVSVPLIAAANTGDRIQNCDSLTFTDIPRNQRVKVRIDFAAKESFRFIDPSPVIASITKVASSVGALTAYGGAPLFAGGAAAVSFLSSNTAPITSLTSAVNELLALMDVKRSPWSTIRSIDPAIGRASYFAKRAEVFALRKEYKETLIEAQPTEAYWSIPNEISKVAKRDWNDIIRDVANAYPAFWENLEKFCPALRNTLSAAVRSDAITVALGLYYHSANYSDNYLTASGRTCLNTRETVLLSDRHWVRPFDGANSFQRVPWPNTPLVRQVMQ